MAQVTPIYVEHTRALFLSERSRREGIRGSLSTPVAAISFTVFAFGNLAIRIDADRWQQLPTLAILVLGAGALVALFASAWQVVMSEWLFVYHEPPRLPDLLDDAGADEEQSDGESIRRLLAASYAVAYEQYLEGNAISTRHRTWSLRLILLALLLQAVAFTILPFHLAGA
ncbi:MAG: hypothetical protein ACTHMG_08525 [Sphingomonas sp.]